MRELSFTARACGTHIVATPEMRRGGQGVICLVCLWDCVRRIAVESKINARGQTTVPAAIRRALGAKAGTRLTWVLLPDGCVLVRAKSKSVIQLAGMLKSDASVSPVDIEQMNPWRD